MRKAVFAIAAGLLAMVLVAPAQPAAAVPISIPLLDPSANGFVPVQMTVDNLLITVTACHLTDASVNSAACSATDNFTLTGVSSFVPGSHPTVTATIQEGDGSSPIFNVLAGDTHTYDLAVSLTVATLGGEATIKSDALAVHGSAGDAGNLTSIGTGETLLGSGFQYLGTINGTAAGPVTQLAFTPQNSISVFKDINDLSANGSGSGPMVLASVSQTFGQVPEPASIVLILTGITALGVLRRRRRG